jgi:hypothetical protein
VLQLNLTEDYRDGRPANLRQTHGGRYGRPDGVLHHVPGVRHAKLTSAYE